MIRAIIEDIAELAGLALFLAALALIAAPADAMALTPDAADAGGYALSGVALAVFVVWGVWRFVRSLGRDAADHDANQADAMRAALTTESPRGME
jgi:membrane protein implicated in regulation of membrane protease activity